MQHIDPDICERRFHYIGGLFLAIDFTAVGNRRTMRQVDRPRRAIVKLPKCLLKFWRGLADVLALKKRQEFRCLGKTGAGIGREPAIGVVCGKLPTSGTAHRETADADPIGIDRQSAANVVEHFEDVDFTGELERIAIAAVGMQHDRIGRRVLASRRLRCFDKKATSLSVSPRP